MHFLLISRVIGFFALGFALSMILPLAVSLLYSDGEAEHFLTAILIILGISLVFLFLGRHIKQDLAIRDGFLVVALFWIGISAMSAIPLVLGAAQLSLVDAFFESVSAFTTTGATVMSGLDDLPPSLLFYRQFLQWLGGMGMIVLAVAVMPMIGVGGMQLYRAEAPGPFKDDKLTPRLAHTARYLWLIYLALTLACAASYWLVGMTGFDAISHALSTVSTGGFSTHDASLGFFQSEAVETVAMIFMLLGAINFSIHFLVWSKKDPRLYWQNPEVRTFLLIVLGAVILVAYILRTSGNYTSLPPDLRDATFEVISVITSTGFGTVDFSHWPDFLPLLLILISFIGGCGGSTAGGLKVMRVMLLARMGYREVRRLIHPKAVFPVKVGHQLISPRVVEAVWGFLAIYVLSFVVLMLMIMHAGLDQISAFSAIATSMNNLGPGLGEVATSFASVSDQAKIIAAFAMLLGRLEIFTLLVLLTPDFWRR